MSELEIKQNIEKESLEKLKQENPGLLKRRTFIEDSKYLSKLGILIPNKETFSNKGFIKLWSEDFIVEEIDQNNQIISIFSLDQFENINPESKNFNATLIKNNIGTHEAILDIAKKINIRDTDIQYAGMKDNDALTSQKISISNTTLDKIKSIKSKNYLLTNIKEENNRIKIGQLNGNNFTILVRTDTKEDNISQISEQVKKIKKEGFYNFYYSQRFGTFGRDNGHVLGLLMLQKKYKEALYMFLTDPPKAGFEFTFNIYKDIDEHYGDWEYIKKIISPYPVIFERELTITDYLIKNPEDILGALNAKKDEVRLWILGFASWMFNMKLSNLLLENKDIPEKIDLITSTKNSVVLEYETELNSVGLNDFDLEHLKRFNIQKANAPIDTKKKVNFQKVASSPYGIIFKFYLDKGSYATTMLAHCLDLIVGTIPANYPSERIDITKSLGEKSISEVFEKLK